MFSHAFGKLLLCMAGGIPDLIAAIKFPPDGEIQTPAAVAVDILFSLTSKGDLPLDWVDEAEGLLLRLQAIPRLSWFLKSPTLVPSAIPGNISEGGKIRLPLCM